MTRRDSRVGVIALLVAAFMAGVVVALGLLHFRPLSITCMIPQVSL